VRRALLGFASIAAGAAALAAAWLVPVSPAKAQAVIVCINGTLHSVLAPNPPFNLGTPCSGANGAETGPIIIDQAQNEGAQIVDAIGEQVGGRFDGANGAGCPECNRLRALIASVENLIQENRARIWELVALVSKLHQEIDRIVSQRAELSRREVQLLDSYSFFSDRSELEEVRRQDRALSAEENRLLAEIGEHQSEVTWRESRESYLIGRLVYYQRQLAEAERMAAQTRPFPLTQSGPSELRYADEPAAARAQYGPFNKAPAKRAYTYPGDRRWTVWLQGQASHLDHSRQQLHATAGGLIGGVDFRAIDNFVVGALFGVNTGRVSGTGTRRDYDGVTAALYFGWRPMPNLNLTVDGSAGVASTSYRTDASGTTSSFRVDRPFFTLGATTSVPAGRFVLKPRVSVFYGANQQPGYSDSAGAFTPSALTEVGRFSFGATLVYPAGWYVNLLHIVPSVYLRGEYDFADLASYTLLDGTIASDTRLGGSVGGALDFARIGNAWSGRLGFGYHSIGRTGQNAFSGEARLSRAF